MTHGDHNEAGATASAEVFLDDDGSAKFGETWIGALFGVTFPASEAKTAEAIESAMAGMSQALREQVPTVKRAETRIRALRGHRHARHIKAPELNTVEEFLEFLEVLSEAIAGGDLQATLEAILTASDDRENTDEGTDDGEGEERPRNALAPPGRSLVAVPILSNAPPARRVGVAA